MGAFAVSTELRDHVIGFGRFQLFPARQLLLEGNRPVRLGSRALEILIVLAERAGEVVNKEDLIARVWPDTNVEEGNLRVHIAALRRTLGDGVDGARYLTNIPGRGYCFVAQVGVSEVQLGSGARAPALEQRRRPPPRPMRTIGRDELIQALGGEIRRERLLTIVGPGGIGKTTVALNVANDVAAAFAGGVVFIDFAQVRDVGLAVSAVASALGLSLPAGEPIAAVAAHLGDSRTLLIFDCCEHVADAVAELVEGLLQETPGVHVLATSREPLRTSTERVRRLEPLPVPPAPTAADSSQALSFPAVQLFVEHVAASDDSFEFTDADAAIVADICRKADGVPLAVELAAGRVAAFGLKGVAALLDDRLRLLTGGRRTALPRHQTLAATMDWSYEALPADEQALLRNLSVFSGPFELDAVRPVAVDPGEAGSDVVEGLANLVAKSLVAVDIAGAAASYRLLDTTRAYARAKLELHQSVDQAASRHARYYRDLLETAAARSEGRSGPEWRERYGHEIDNIRSALDWAFSPTGDAEIAVALTTASIPLWSELLLMDECLARVEQALAASSAQPAQDQGLRLLAARANALVQTHGASGNLNAE